MDTTVIENGIKQRAFELFVKRGGIHGNDQEDWYQAEKEVRDLNGKLKPNKRSNAKS
ncbi:MAG: DUF2934 domain-containing protein [Chitinispirillaceae bacterium]|nr:DUF2934 domain-containing protein [Chitinispirillaceae bacterium]